MLLFTILEVEEKVHDGNCGIVTELLFQVLNDSGAENSLSTARNPMEPQRLGIDFPRAESFGF